MQEEKREFQGLLGKEWAQKGVKSYCLEWVYSYLWDGMRENGVKVVRVMWNTIVLNTLTI
jgi:hypothetical protein